MEEEGLSLGTSAGEGQEAGCGPSGEMAICIAISDLPN